MFFFNFQPYELKLLSTHDAGVDRWSPGFTVMPQSGHVIVNGKEVEDAPWYLLVFSLKDGKLNGKKISSSCGHTYVTFLSALIVDGREKFVVSCWECDDLKLLDLQTGGWSTAFKGCKPYALCSGGSGTIFIQSRKDRSILQLDATSSVFKGPVRTLHTHIICLAMCYIPPPVNALVLSDGFSSKMVALSVERYALLWELQREKGGVYHATEEGVLDRTGLLFHPEYNVLFVADGIRRRVLIVDPGTGGLIQTIDLPDMGNINALGLYKDQIVMLHYDDSGRKISYLNLFG